MGNMASPTDSLATAFMQHSREIWPYGASVTTWEVTHVGHTGWGVSADGRPLKVMTLRAPADHDLHALAPSVLSTASLCLLTSVSLGWWQPVQSIQGSRREETELLALPLPGCGHRKPGRIFPTTTVCRCLAHQHPFSFSHKHSIFS